MSSFLSVEAVLFQHQLERRRDAGELLSAAFDFQAGIGIMYVARTSRDFESVESI